MNKEYKYDLQSAIKADKEGTLFDWAQQYLRGEGWNQELANKLVEHDPHIIHMLEFPLMNLNRTMGPEAGMPLQEKMDIWEKRVTILVDKIKEGVELPPIIVTDFGNDLEISDGSHRYEALIRTGYEKYWTIFFFDKDESKRYLL